MRNQRALLWGRQEGCLAMAQSQGAQPLLPLLQLLLLAAVALNPSPNVEDRWCTLGVVPGDLEPAGYGSVACRQLALGPIACLGLWR